jgi:hypothetical protein
MKVILQWACVLLLSGAGNVVFAATVNLPPTITGQPATAVTANTAYSFTPTADDPEKARLTFTIKGKPIWASFNTATGALTGKPTGKQASTYSNIVITVSDGRSRVNLAAFSIQVNNPAPIITGTPAASVLANQAYGFTPSVSDSNNDPLVFSIVKKPVWAKFNTKTGELTGTPKSSQATLYKDILIKVFDGKNIVNLPAFNITVENPAPTISGTPQTIATVRAAYSFTPTASDANNDALVFTIKNKPLWATFNAKTGALTGTPTDKNLGTKSQITISVSDGRNVVSLDTFELVVANPNTPPTISGTPATSVNIGEVYSFTPTASDADAGDTLIFSINDAKPTWATFDTTTGRLSGTPTAAGTSSAIIISITDGKSPAVALESFNIVVSAPSQDTDGDGTPDITDTDDDNDNVPDNDDYRPLDPTIQTIPVHSGRVNSYEQTYVRADNASTNYSSQSSLLVRSINGSFATAGLLYFDIPETLNGKRTDNISKAALTLRSDTEKDTLKFYASTNAAFPSAATATWSNTQPLFGTTLYGQVAASAGASSSVVLSQKLSSGKTVFVVDETGDSSRERLVKSNTETYLDLEFSETDPAMVNITPVAGSQATQSGGQLKYQVSLAQAPTQDVHVPLVLASTTTATLTPTELVFTAANYNTPQTVTITGKDDGSNQGTKANRLLVYPLHSEDNAYNGHNPTDLDFNIYATLPAAQSGQTYTAQADYSSSTAKFELLGAPIGMSINEKTGVITWQPDSSEMGSYDFTILAKENGTTVYNKAVSLQVTLAGSNPTDAFYVVPNGAATNPTGALGSITNPYTTIETALAAASLNASKRTVYVRGGRFDNTAVTIDNVDGAEGNQVVLTRLPGERVKFEFSGIQAFGITENASYVVIDGFEIDGNATVDHWEMLRSNWWNPLGDRAIGGGQGFNVDGQHITIRNNVIHDAYQKAVNIYAGRYINVHNNVIYNIGHISLSGGHGIMRKWERNFSVQPTDGNQGVDVYTDTYPYRFDITGNLLLAVEQRIYSRVFNKGYSLLVLDEGKPILIDETQDTDLRSRISHNLVLYGGVDHIRLKQNPNMEVHNNSILPDLSRTDTAPDGITDKTKLPNLKFYGNLIASKGIAVDLDDSFMVNGVDEDPMMVRKYANYIGGGGTFTSNLRGVTNLGADVNNLFSNVATNDFRSVVTDPAGIPVGVSEAYLTTMMDLVDEYAIGLTPSGWMNQHLRNAETLMANVPSDVFDTSTYYIGTSSIEEGHQALFLKFKDSDGTWLYNKLGASPTSAAWNALQNKDLINTALYDLPNVAIQKCNNCKGAYTFQLVLPHEWFDVHQSDATINGATLVRLDPNIPEHKAIMEYSAAGKVKSY